MFARFARVPQLHRMRQCESRETHEKPVKTGNFSEKPKKIVEITCFPIDFAHTKAAW
jgi:hypothetical protein